MKYFLTIFAVVILLSATNLYADIFYVKQGATGTGVSWADAFGTLQQALDEAESSDEIWVAEGTYYPTTQVGGSGERYRTFQMKNGVAIYGGFPASGDPDMDDRDWEANETILSGDIGVAGDNADNCYHVFYHPDGLGPDDTAVIDGFTIRDGNASTYPHDSGGGMYNGTSSSPTISNCSFTSNTASNSGGGMTNYYSSPIISNCSFTNNSAGERGGGMFNYENSPTISNCSFTNNSAANSDGGGMFNYENSPTISNCSFTSNSAGESGGGMYYYDSSPSISNCTITSNTAANWGGGMYNYLGSPNISNCTFSNNWADYGGAIYNLGGNHIISNSIIWGNTANSEGNQFFINGFSTTLNYSCYANGTNDVAVRGGSPFTATNNNITEDPLFVGSGDHPYSLQPTSPCINTGSNALVPVGVTTDIIGNPRISFGTVDMGAYESEFYTLVVSITPDEKNGICYDSPVNLVAEIDDVEILGGAVAPLTYSWSPTFLVEHSDPSSPVATLTRAIRDAVYTLTVTDANGMQGTATVSVEVLAGNVISNPGTIVHSFRAEDIEAPLNLFALALGEDYEDIYDEEDYDLEFECRLGWLPPGEESCEEFNATAYIPLPDSRLYGWIIIKHSGGCEADRRRINVIVRGNEVIIEQG